jgi:hypothetical protein
VVREPGNLQMLPRAGLEVWRSEVERLLTAPAPKEPQRLLIRPNRNTPHTLATEWTGLPHRVVSCIGRQAALALLDWPGSQGDEGRRRLQEEYLEWRTVRYPDGLIRRIELTTELPEYWATLAAYAPAELLGTIADFAQETILIRTLSSVVTIHSPRTRRPRIAERHSPTRVASRRWWKSGRV